MRNNSESNFWFKRRRYGYGWTPVAWQGWLTVVLFLALVVFGAEVILGDAPKDSASIELVLFFTFIIITMLLAVLVSYMKGPKPKWRWGGKLTDNPDEDI